MRPFKNKTPFTVNLEAGEKARLDEYAASIDRSSGWVVRQAVLGYLDKHYPIDDQYVQYLEDLEPKSLSGWGGH